MRIVKKSVEGGRSSGKKESVKKRKKSDEKSFFSV